MKKIINDPTECGYRGVEHGKCFHPKTPLFTRPITRQHCSDQDFPDFCPLKTIEIVEKAVDVSPCAGCHAIGSEYCVTSCKEENIS